MVIHNVSTLLRWDYVKNVISADSQWLWGFKQWKTVFSSRHSQIEPIAWKLLIKIVFHRSSSTNQAMSVEQYNKREIEKKKFTMVIFNIVVQSNSTKNQTLYCRISAFWALLPCIIMRKKCMKTYKSDAAVRNLGQGWFVLNLRQKKIVKL